MILASSCGAGHRNEAELSVGFPSRSRDGIQKGLD